MENQIADSHYLPFVESYASALHCKQVLNYRILGLKKTPGNYSLQFSPSILKLEVQRKITSKCKRSPGLWKPGWQSLGKLDLYLSRDRAILLLGIYPTEMLSFFTK